jgi:hypothetical protein
VRVGEERGGVDWVFEGKKTSGLTGIMVWDMILSVLLLPWM